MKTPLCTLFSSFILFPLLKDHIYRDDMVNDTVTMTINFPGDGVYTCDITMISPVDSHNASYVFTVQYAIPNVLFGLANFDQSQFAAYETLWSADDFQKVFHFLVLRETGSPLPTNTSWRIDFGNDVIAESSDFINVDDLDRGVAVLGYDHTITLSANYTVGGDFTASITLWNLISNFTTTVDYRIYEEIYMPEINTILHYVSYHVTHP